MPTLFYTQKGNTFWFGEEMPYVADVRVRNNDPVKMHEAFLMFRDWAKRRRGADVKKQEPKSVRFAQDGADFNFRIDGGPEEYWTSAIHVKDWDMEAAGRAYNSFVKLMHSKGVTTITRVGMLETP